MRGLVLLSALLAACVTPPLLTCPDGQAYCGGSCVDPSAAVCSALADPCGNTCVANASCVSTPAGASCLCKPGFTGPSCAACHACSPTEYLVAGCTPDTDSLCAPLTMCGSAQYEATPPTPTSDRVCASCTPIAQCTQLVCMSASDSLCLSCAPGFFGPQCQPMTLPPAPDCFAILQASLSMGDGFYMLDPDGPGPVPAFLGYCDMSGGGWTLLNDQDVNVAPGYQSAATWRAGVSTTPPNGGQWGVLQLATSFISMNGTWEFRLTFGQDTTSSVVSWRQSGDPTVGARGTLSNVLMTPASQVSCAGPFAGLADDGVSSAAWAGETGCGLAFAVGTSAQVGGGIPAYDNSAAGALVTDRARLWVRVNAP